MNVFVIGGEMHGDTIVSATVPEAVDKITDRFYREVFNLDGSSLRLINGAPTVDLHVAPADVPRDPNPSREKLETAIRPMVAQIEQYVTRLLATNEHPGH